MDQSPESTQSKKILALTNKHLHELRMDYSPECVVEKAAEQSIENGTSKLSSDGKDPIFRAMTLSEFENGLLLSTSSSEYYKTFAIDFMRKIQQEYRCVTPSEKATAELIALNYTRTLDIQRRMTN